MITQKLIAIQSKLKAPKNQRNNFGKYNYRSCEDILEAVKPHLVAEDVSIMVTDTIKEVAGIPYVEARAVFFDGEGKIEVTAQAGIDPNRKGMDIAQSFGSSSSYARKYALNGLLLIDDTKDADATNTHGKADVTKTVTKKKLTAEIKTAMKKAIQKGQIEAVLAKLETYQYTEKDRAEILA